MKMILLGAPGAGKGTQAVRIAEKYGVPHISTGDIFRKNIKEGTPIGLVAKALIDKGQLVPDEVTVQIVKDRLQEADCKNGFLLDGFPRTTAQAVALDAVTTVDVALNLDVDLGKLLARITGRRVCASCGESYHVDFLNGADVCKKCGGALIQRADDTEETVAKRLDVYRASTEPLIDYYAAKGVLKNVSANGTIDEVFAEACKVLG